MGWVFYGEAPAGFNEQVIGDFLIGDELIKVEHLFDGLLPGFGHALISNVYANGERDFFRRSYPYKNSARIYTIKVPEQLQAAGYSLHQLLIKWNRGARWVAKANWRVRIYVWRGDSIPTAINAE